MVVCGSSFFSMLVLMCSVLLLLMVCVVVMWLVVSSGEFLLNISFCVVCVYVGRLLIGR